MKIPIYVKFTILKLSKNFETNELQPGVSHGVLKGLALSAYQDTSLVTSLDQIMGALPHIHIVMFRGVLFMTKILIQNTESI